MKIAIRLQIEAGDGGPCDQEILSLDKPHDQLERLGLSLAEARELLPASRNASLAPRPRRSLPTVDAATRAADIFGARGKPRFGSARRSATCR